MKRDHSLSIDNVKINQNWFYVGRRWCTEVKDTAQRMINGYSMNDRRCMVHCTKELRRNMQWVRKNTHRAKNEWAHKGRGWAQLVFQQTIFTNNSFLHTSMKGFHNLKCNNQLMKLFDDHVPWQWSSNSSNACSYNWFNFNIVKWKLWCYLSWLNTCIAQSNSHAE